MQRGYYIYYSSKTGFIGVDKKVDNQIKIFNQYTHCEKIVIERETGNIVKSILWRLPFGSFGRHYEVAYDMIRNPDYIYIRFVPVDRKFLSFIKTLRKKFPLCKIILEVATYPYGKELLNNPAMLSFYFKDRFNGKRLKKYVDEIVTYSDDSSIWGIPTLNVKNGIIVDDIRRVKIKKHCGEKIVLLAVAIFQKSHGYERCLKGLAEYKKINRRKVEIHFVGDGTELAYYKRLVRELSIEESVIFHGRKDGEDLDHLYDLADIALGIFGLYKVKIYKSSALKIREYLARGLPIVSGCVEDAFHNEKKDFFLQFPNDNSVIDINKVVQFYEDIYECGVPREDIHNNIRLYAKENVDMSVVLQPVIRYIKE